MIQTISTITAYSPFNRPDDALKYNPLVDYELGGIGLNNASQGLRVQWWKAEHVAGDIVLTPLVSGSPVTILSGLVNVTEVSLAFDNLMQPHISYVSAGIPHLWWYNSLTAQMEHRAFPGINTPRMTLDIHSPLQSANADIIFAYTIDDTLYCRLQRDRFDTQYTLKVIRSGIKLNKVGMCAGNRIEYELV